MLDMQGVTKRLRDNGFKVTPQRLAVYEALQGTKEHPNAEMLYSILQPAYPTMSLATVYKTMDILSEIGLVQILNVGEDSYRYDANTSSHPHVCCTSCGRVDDVLEVDDNAFTDMIAAKSSYKLSGRQMYFFGQCPDCQSQL